MSGLPPGTLGDAIGVLLYTFFCLFSGFMLIWLLWIHQDRIGYLALIAYFMQLCTLSSIVQQIYHYSYYEDIAWAQLQYIKDHYPNAEVIFKNGNFGFMLGLANLRFFCYIIESTYLMTYTLHIAMSIYGFWASHRRAERVYVMISKFSAPLLTAMWIGLEYTPVVQRSWTTYMVVANIQAVACCTISIFLNIMIMWKFIDGKRLWNNIKTATMLNGSSLSWKQWMLRSWRGRSGDSPAGSVQSPQTRSRAHVPKALLDNSWLVMRLSIAIVLISCFILATVLLHLPTLAQMAQLIKSDAPDLSVSHARSSIVGYIYGVTPGLAIPIVFGLTRPFRQTLRKRLVPKFWQSRHRFSMKPTTQVPGRGIQAPAPAETSLGSRQDVPGAWGSSAMCSTSEPVPVRPRMMKADLPSTTNEDSYELIARNDRQGESGATGPSLCEVSPITTQSTASLDSLIVVESHRAEGSSHTESLGFVIPSSHIRPAEQGP